MKQRKETTFAQEYMYDSYNGFGMNWWNTNLPSQYKLEANQIVELNEYRIDYDIKILPLLEELIALQIKIKTNNEEFAMIKYYYNKVRDIQNKMIDIRLDAKEEMSSVFTKSQQVYFNSSRVGWWDDFYNRCGWNNADIKSDYLYR
ncbi:hypothetical protein MNBD_IGNAVI01-3055 [hydrothermal vent metagenome]|uniref:Uncharacterized protein n=1 Tax=hydrothermal vent metagenome TaxID=652676 RepID=A0A3B1CNJ0_9ZZZZ